MAAGPHIINHNVEPPPAHYARIRPQADYAQSLELLRRVREGGHVCKSGLMVGLGETDGEVCGVLEDLAAVGCDIVTIGQYMRPSRRHPQVERYVHPDMFAAYARRGGAGHPLRVLPRRWCAAATMRSRSMRPLPGSDGSPARRHPATLRAAPPEGPARSVPLRRPSRTGGPWCGSLPADRTGHVNGDREGGIPVRRQGIRPAGQGGTRRRALRGR